MHIHAMCIHAIYSAIVLGFLTPLLSFSLSGRAQVPSPFLKPSASEPLTETNKTPNLNQSQDANQEEIETENTIEESEENPEEDNSLEERDEAGGRGNLEDTDRETLPLENGESDAPESDAPEEESEEEDQPEESADAPLPPLPEGCELLPLVDGEGNQVTKRTSPPSFTIPIPLPGPIPDPQVQSNWNTDWYIPNAQEFNRYRVTLMPHSSGRYSIQMFFKYPNETADRFYQDQEIRLTANEPLIIEAEPRSDLPPYQINTNIGGILSIGVRYTISVAGCRNEAG